MGSSKALEVIVEGFVFPLVTAKESIAISVNRIDRRVVFEEPLFEGFVGCKGSTRFDLGVVFASSEVCKELSHVSNFIDILSNSCEAPIGLHAAQPLSNGVRVLVGFRSLEGIRFASDPWIWASGLAPLNKLFAKKAIFDLESKDLGSCELRRLRRSIRSSIVSCHGR